MRLAKKPAAKHAFTPVNHVHLVGVVHDIQTGFVASEPVTQFSVTTVIGNVNDVAPEKHPLPPKSTASLAGMAKAKESFTIRCFGAEVANEARAAVSDGCVAEVQGQLILNPNLDSASGKYQYFPYVSVRHEKGQVRMLHGKKGRKAATAVTDSQITSPPTPAS